ncbi:MAG: PEP-utilizing enzyme [Myxococcota bacterium]
MSAAAPLVLALGSGAVAGCGAGGKGAMLDRAAQRGLPVPAGRLLRDEAWRTALASDWVAADDPRAVIARNSAELVEPLGLSELTGSLAVRSAFSAEDGGEASLAGYFTSVLHVPGDDAAAVADALCQVWSSAAEHDERGSLRRDVLIMDMVAARHAGVAFTERAHEDDRINYTEGTAEELLSGADNGRAALLPKLRRWERRGREHLPDVPFADRLQRLLRDVRQVFGATDWDVEWADDGTTCWLLQIRPITRSLRRNEAFTLANHKEILPDLPSRFMTSLIAECADALFDYYRRFDSELPADRPFIEVIGGRPLINLSLMTDMMRVWGMPTRLVTDSIGGDHGRAFGPALGRLGRKLPVLVKLGWAQLGAVGSARRTSAALVRDSDSPGDTFAACAATLARIYTALVSEMFSLTAAMSGPLALLRKLGTLAEHNARHETVATSMYNDLDRLRTEIAPGQAAKLAAHCRRGTYDGDGTDAGDSQEARIRDEHAGVDPASWAAWNDFLRRHGHRGIYESDIARQRFAEEPGPLLTILGDPSGPGRVTAKPRRTLRGVLSWPIWLAAARPMRAREQLRYQAMRAFAQVRRRLLALADDEVRRGALPERESLWSLSVGEARSLDDGWSPGPEFWTERADELAAQRAITLPDLVHRFDDIASAPRDGLQRSALSGIGLTAGEIRGRAWVLDEPATDLPDGFAKTETILIARSVDAGWIPTFARVAGVVVETGGDLSHGSIILREIGLPAITNASGATRALATGDSLVLHAGAGRVERVAP